MTSFLRADVEALMAAFAASDWQSAYAFGTLLDRLGSVGSEGMRAALCEHLDRPAALALFSAWPQANDAELYDLDQLAWGLANIDNDLCLDGLDRVADVLADRWQEDFVEGWSRLPELQFVLGMYPTFLHPPPPTPRQRAVARRIVEGLDPEAVASRISASTRREWEPIGHAVEFLAKASPRHAKRIAGRVDLDALDRATAPDWARSTDVFRGLTYCLARGSDDEPAASWFRRHVGEMEQIDDTALVLVGEAAAARARELGQPVRLHSIEVGSWRWVGGVLSRLIEIDPELALSSVRAAGDELAKAFTAAAHAEDEPLDKMLALLAELDREALRAIVARVDAERAEEVWERRLRGRISERRAVAILVDLALECETPIGDVARRLHRRFPRATVP